MKKHYLHILILLFLVNIPLAAGATTTESAFGISEQMLSSEKVDHGQIELRLGIVQRINSSPTDLAEADLTPGQVFNKRLFGLYIRKLALTERIQRITVSDDEVLVDMKGEAYLFGFIPVSLPHEVVVTIDGRITDVTVDNKSSWSWMMRHQNASVIETNIQTTIEESRYLSAIQLKAYVLEAIISSINS